MKIYEYNGKEYLTEKDFFSQEGIAIKTREINGTGTVYSLTTVHVPPTEFQNEAPYTLAVIQLQDANIKLTARVKSNVEIGNQVQFDTYENGIYYFIS